MAGNTVILAGNLTRDPELKVTGGGMMIAEFGIAVNKRTQNKVTKEWEDAPPAFYNVTAFGDLASHASESFTKGDRVLIEGRLDFQTWQDKEGNSRQAVKIIADDLGPSLKYATAMVQRVKRADHVDNTATPYLPDEEEF